MKGMAELAIGMFVAWGGALIAAIWAPFVYIGAGLMVSGFICIAVGMGKLQMLSSFKGRLFIAVLALVTIVHISVTALPY